MSIKTETAPPGSGEALLQPASGETPNEAAARHGYRLDQRDDVTAGIDWVLQNVGVTTVVAIHPITRVTEGLYLSPNTQADVVAWATKKNAAGWNLYFQINEPRPGLNKKALKLDITKVRSGAYADMDAKNGRSLEQVIAAIGTLPTPDLIIASGGGCQPIWLLPEPIDPTPEVIGRIEALGQWIAQLTGNDAVQNIDRVLRLPFTVNYPNAKKISEGRTQCLSGLLIPEIKS